MNALALATRGYLCLCGSPMVSGVSPETAGDEHKPYTIHEEVSAPRTVVQTVTDLKPVTKPRRRR